jgi:hypothetical protein
MVARDTYHPDVKCECGTVIPGNAILGGYYDPPPLENAWYFPFLAGLIVGGFWGGVALIFLGPIIGAIVALGFFVFCSIVGTVNMNRSRRK